MLDVTRQLYNALRKPLLRLDSRLAAGYRETEDAVLHRLDLAMQAFFRRCKRGETPGFPRYKPGTSAGSS